MSPPPQIGHAGPGASLRCCGCRPRPRCHPHRDSGSASWRYSSRGRSCSRSRCSGRWSSTSARASPRTLGDPLAQAWQLAWGGHALIDQPRRLLPVQPVLAGDATGSRFSDALAGYAPLARFPATGSRPRSPATTSSSCSPTRSPSPARTCWRVSSGCRPAGGVRRGGGVRLRALAARAGRPPAHHVERRHPAGARSCCCAATGARPRRRRSPAGWWSRGRSRSASPSACRCCCVLAGARRGAGDLRGAGRAPARCRGGHRASVAGA